MCFNPKNPVLDSIVNSLLKDGGSLVGSSSALLVFDASDNPAEFIMHDS